MAPVVVPFIAGTLGIGTVAATAIFYVSTSVVLAWAVSKKKSDLSSQSGQTGLVANNIDGLATQEFIYGQVRKGGTIPFMESTGENNRFLHMTLCLAGHEVEEIGSIYINDKIVSLDSSGYVTSSPWNGYIRIIKKLGSADQLADPSLVAETSVDESFRGRGIAYLYVRLEYNQDVFVNGIPTFSAVVKGRKVFDPRTFVHSWSDNAILCIRDYISQSFGLGDPRVDDPFLQLSANVCDEVVPTLAGSEKRYTMNGVISSDKVIGENLKSMLTSCAGICFWGQGKWKVKAGYHSTPVANFTIGNVLGPISIEPRVSISDNFNSVTGIFNDASRDWIPVDYPRVSSNVFLTEDNGVQSTLDLPLEFTTSSAMAQRIAKQTLFRAREQITINCDFDTTALAAEVGDIVTLTIERYGWVEKQFEVVNWRLGRENLSLKVNLTLRETSEAAFDSDSDEVEIISNNTNLPDPWTAPPVGINLTSTTRVVYEKLTNVLIVRVSTSAFISVDSIEVQYKPSANTEWEVVGTGSVGIYEIVDLEDGFYDVRARGKNQFGFRGEWEIIPNFQISNIANSPNTVTGFKYSLSGPNLILEWNAVPDLDLSHYQLRYSFDNTSASFGNSITLVDKVSRPGTTVTVPARPGTYMIRAVDKSGSVSGDYTVLVVPEGAFEQFAFTQSLIQHPTFPGTRTNLTLSSGALSITSGSSGTYSLSGTFDVGGSKRVRTRVDFKIIRDDPNAGLFDSIPGLFDNIPGRFDDFTGLTSFNDINMKMFIRFSDNAVDWSGWQELKAGDFFGRYFQYYVELTTDKPGITPVVDYLVARLWHN